MTPDINPHWTSTDLPSAGGGGVQGDGDSVQQGVRGAVQPKRVKIKRNSYGSIVAGITGVVALGIVFTQGVSFITASLTQDPDDGAADTSAVLESQLTMEDIPLIPSLEGLDQTSVPTIPAIPAIPTIPAIPNVPTIPAIPNVPTVPTIDLGQAVTDTATANTAWPSIIRTNRFTIGSGLVPAFSPTSQIPIHVVRQAQDQVHAAARAQQTATGISPLVTRQPSTGPALGVVGLLSLLGVPLFWRKK